MKHPDCPTCICGRRAPVQAEGEYRTPERIGPGTVSWVEYLEAYAKYSGRYGNDQSPERLAARGGFGYYEMAMLLGHEPATWRPR
jgi:hypothetical protein